MVDLAIRSQSGVDSENVTDMGAWLQTLFTELWSSLGLKFDSYSPENRPNTLNFLSEPLLTEIICTYPQ